MADTTFTDAATLVVSAWLQDLNNVYYRLTANRIPYATGTALTTSANLTFDGTVLATAGTTDSTSITTGTITTAGGLGVVKALWVGGLANIAGAVTLQSTLGVTGNTILTGDLSVNGAVGAHAASKLSLAQGSSTQSNITAYGPNATTSGTFAFEIKESDGGGFGQVIGVSNTGAVTIPGTLGVTGGVYPGATQTAAALISQASSGAGTTTTYIGNQTITTASDIRIKANVTDTKRNALELLNKLRVVDHTWNDPSDKSENNRNMRGVWTGLIAQEAQPIIPWLVNKPLKDEEEDGTQNLWHMDYGYAVPLLIKAIQELSVKLEQRQ